MTLFTGNGSDIIQGTSHEVGDKNYEKLVLGTW